MNVRQQLKPFGFGSLSVRKAQEVRAEAEITLVLSAVAEYFGLSMAELRENARTRVVVIPRQIAMYLTKQITNPSTGEPSK
jgi:chromosomal replication initiation ATPase DnaA